MGRVAYLEPIMQNHAGTLPLLLQVDVRIEPQPTTADIEFLYGNFKAALQSKNTLIGFFEFDHYLVSVCIDRKTETADIEVFDCETHMKRVAHLDINSTEDCAWLPEEGLQAPALTIAQHAVQRLQDMNVLQRVEATGVSFQAEC